MKTLDCHFSTATDKIIYLQDMFFEFIVLLPSVVHDEQHHPLHVVPEPVADLTT